MKLYYAAEGSFYAASVLMLLVWEERRRDFGPMLAHHIVTVALIAASYRFSCAPPTLCRGPGTGQLSLDGL